MKTHPKPGRHWTWEQFNALIKRGIPAIHRISGDPDADFFVDDGGIRIGIRIQMDQTSESFQSPFKEIQINQVVKRKITCLEISTSSRQFYQDFYSFLVTLTDKVQLEGLPPLTALKETHEGWKELLRPKIILSEDQQLGLMGELLVLQRIFHKFWKDAIDSWTGPLREPHDFRLGQKEFEVKTTRNVQRIHIISSIEQLVPSPGRYLYLLSVQFAPAGANAGDSLVDMVRNIRRLLGKKNESLAKFNRLLRENVGYLDEHAAFYGVKYILRTKPSLVPVDVNCPKLTREQITLILGEKANRINDLQYRVNLDGLGFEDGTSGFNKILS